MTQSALNLNGIVNLAQYEDKVFSQHGEDGIIAWLVEKIKPMHYFVEFGVEDGLECNTRLLAAHNWRGMQIEAREDCWHDLVKLNAVHRQRVHSVRAMLTLDNIDEVFNGVPWSFGFCSIDVDGNDLYFFEYIARAYAPQIVCVEVNQHKPEDVEYVQQWTMRAWNGMTYNYGASLRSMVEAGNRRDYTFVGRESTGVNAFFVRNDCVAQLA